MKQVQNALRDIGIPVMAGVWRATSPNQNPPQQYVVYSTTKTESSHSDDHVSAVRTFVYQRRAARMEGTYGDAIGYFVILNANTGDVVDAYQHESGMQLELFY